VSSKLRQDPTIDSVVTLGPSLGVAVQQQLEQDGSTAKVVTYAFNNDLIPMLQNGKVAFTIDQQPYLQGYLSIDSLWLYRKNKSVIGSQQSIPTGPVVIDQANIGDILDGVKAGLR
jgi:simple sugar transport system substrate-binding protein